MDKNAQYPPTFDGLLNLARDLRGPDGCPWDREQTRDSMKRYIQEECYELLEAIDEGVAEKIAEELGDVLYHMAFQVVVGSEDDAFTEEQVFGTLIEKLVRRHPHVFGDAEASDPQAIESSWHAIKRAEKEKAGTKTSTMDGVPGALPAPLPRPCHSGARGPCRLRLGAGRRRAGEGRRGAGRAPGGGQRRREGS